MDDWLATVRGGDNNLRERMRDRMSEIINSHCQQ